MTPNRLTLRLRARASFIVLCLAACMTARLAAAAAVPAPERVGRPVTGAVGVRTTVAEIQALDARLAKPEQPVLMPEHEGPDRDGLPQNPASPHVSALPAGAGARKAGGAFGLQVMSPQTVGTSFTAATLFGTNPTGAFPPDCMGAVGPTQYIVEVNERIVSFNKSTGVADGVLNTTTNAFFNAVRNGSGTSDPRIRYDRLTARWFLLIINVSGPTNRILIAVSDAASAGVITNTTVWTEYYIDVDATPPTLTNCFADYPTLGIDANALYIGTDNFCGATSQTFSGTDGYVVRKTSVLSGGPIVVTAFRGLAVGNGAGPFAPQGVDNFDPGSTEGYFIGSDNASQGTLALRRVSTPGGTPSISANILITVPSTAEPMTVPHLGNTGGSAGQLDALDTRLFAAHIRNGRLWTAHNLATDNTGQSPGSAPTRDGARWYELAVPTGSGTPTIVQSGTVYTPSGTNIGDQRYYWIPSVMVSGQGHAAMGFSTAGTQEYANAGTVGRLVDDPLGTMESPVLFTTATTAYNPSGDPGTLAHGRRWGDYSYTSLDPLDDMTMWTVQEFTNATDSYGVRVAKLIAPPPATLASMGDVPVGQSAFTVTLFGTEVSGSGFYDPGANLPGVPAFHHLAVAISNGSASGTPPTVSSLTYVSPTQINLVLNTSSATANLSGQKYTITVTNPDGQTVAAALVHVVASVPSVSIGAGPSLNEGNSGTTPFNFPVTLSAASASAVTVYYTVNDGSATAADHDFQGGASSITIPAGQTSGTITVNVYGDTKHESNETFGVTITGAASASVGAPSTSTATILNDDAVPTVSFTTANIAQNEGDSGLTPYTYHVGLSNPTDQIVTVNYHTVDQTATVADGDYQSASSVLNIAAGSVLDSITVNGVGDTRFEPDETFRLLLSAPTNATLVAPLAVTSTLLNDDPAPLVSVADTAVVEGNSGTTTMNFRVSLSSPAGSQVDITYQTGDGTATTADNDYVAASGTVSIPAHGSSAYIPVLVNGDTKKESNETFSVQVTDVTNAELLKDQGVGTIIDDDQQPVVAIHDTSVTEGNSGTTPARFPVLLSNATDQTVTVDWHTADSTATVGDNDYAAGAGTLTFAPNVVADTITVLVNGDTNVEPDEKFTVLLSNPANAAIAGAEGVGTIVNDDGSTGVADQTVTAFALAPVVPNPTATAASVRYAVPRAARVRVAIVDVQGREIARLADGERAPGRYVISWNTRSAGGLAGAGVYFVRMTAPGVKIERRFAIVR